MPLKRYLERNDASVQTLLSVLEILGEPDESKRTTSVEQVRGTVSFPTSNAGRDTHLRKLGYYSETEIIILLSQYDPQGTTGSHITNNITFLSAVIETLLKYAILMRAPVFAQDRYQIDGERLKIFRLTGFIENILYGPSFILKRYAASVPAINVKTKDKDEQSGTGIYCKYKVQDTIRSFILTNRHVVENNCILSVEAGSVQYECLGEPIMCNHADLALIEVLPKLEARTVCLLGSDPDTLTDVISLGYPRVPFADGQYAFAHKGEVNGRLKTTMGEQYLAISCHVSPGNSGGPIFDQKGECVGLVAESKISLFEPMGGQGKENPVSDAAIYHMAVPADEIDKFLDEAIGPNRQMAFH